MAEPKAPEIGFPLWTCLELDGRQHFGADDDGSPLLPIWQTMELASQQSPPGTILRELDETLFEKRLKACPGDSTVAFFLENGMRYRLPVKRALHAILNRDEP